jgi:choline dehydrogenase
MSSLGIGQPLSLTFSNYALAFSTWAQKGLQQLGIQPRKGFTSGQLMGSSYVIAAIEHTTGIRKSSETAFLRPALERSNLVV